MGFPAGVGESCSGFLRVASTPKFAPSAAGSLSKKPPDVASKNRSIMASAMACANLK